MPDLREASLFSAGLLLGTANTIRHRTTGYRTPRTFRPDDIQRTIEYAVDVADRLEHHGEIDWSNKRVLEIGPGSDMTTGLVILHRGAASYQAVDLFDNRSQASAQIYEQLADHLGASFDPSSLRFTQTSFPLLPDIDGEYDLIISNACLEHIAADSMPALFERFAELSAPDGLLVHHIDAKAHMRWFRDHDPLNPLRYPNSVYRLMLDFPGAPNRLRSNEYCEIARRTGWEPRTLPIAFADPAYVERTRVSRRFRSRDDLGTLTFTLIARRELPEAT